MGNFHIKPILLAALLVLLLTGCGKGPNTAGAASSYTVRFAVAEGVESTQSVKQDQLPQQPILPEGLWLWQWYDPAGNAVDPFSIPVSQDITYTGKAYPALTSHLPFLFLDADRLLQPYSPLTGDALQTALMSLAAPGADAYFPALPTESEAVSSAQLAQILKQFFPDTEVDSAFPDQTEEPVTRNAFAVGMYALLKRDSAELLHLGESITIPADIPLGTDSAICLLEASVPHTPMENGDTWLTLQLHSVYEPGIVNIHGYLYYVQEDGTFLRDGDVGQLHFGKDGRYTSTDTDLDKTVADILADITAAAPDGQRLDWLRTAFEYCRDSFTYRRRAGYAMGQTGWDISDAKTMFETKKGNCYNFAAAFWALARGLGYEARAVSGTALQDHQPHGWVFIDIDGETYIFDPEWEYVYRYERNDFTKDMFMLTLSKGKYWNYRW